MTRTFNLTVADPVANFERGYSSIMLPTAPGREDFEKSHIPGAQFMPIEHGGHLCIVMHSEQIIPAVEAFIHDQFTKN